MANWTPDGFIGQLFKTIGKASCRRRGVESPALWGSRERINELFGAQRQQIDVATRHFKFRYRSPAHWLEIFKTYYGPVLKAFAALDAAGSGHARERDRPLVARFNRSRDPTVVVPSEYLEAVITRD